MFEHHYHDDIKHKFSDIHSLLINNFKQIFKSKCRLENL